MTSEHIERMAGARGLMTGGKLASARYRLRSASFGCTPTPFSIFSSLRLSL